MSHLSDYARDTHQHARRDRIRRTARAVGVALIWAGITAVGLGLGVARMVHPG